MGYFDQLKMIAPLVLGALFAITFWQSAQDFEPEPAAVPFLENLKEKEHCQVFLNGEEVAKMLAPAKECINVFHFDENACKHYPLEPGYNLLDLGSKESGKIKRFECNN